MRLQFQVISLFCQTFIQLKFEIFQKQSSERTQVAADAIGTAVTEKIGGENGVTPVGEAHADLLEHPARVGSVPVRHVHRPFDLTI